MAGSDPGHFDFVRRVPAKMRRGNDERKTFFTIRVDVMFTNSLRRKFTNARDATYEMRVIA